MQNLNHKKMELEDLQILPNHGIHYTTSPIPISSHPSDKQLQLTTKGWHIGWLYDHLDEHPTRYATQLLRAIAERMEPIE